MANYFVFKVIEVIKAIYYKVKNNLWILNLSEIVLLIIWNINGWDSYARLCCRGYKCQNMKFVSKKTTKKLQKFQNLQAVLKFHGTKIIHLKLFYIIFLRNLSEMFFHYKLQKLFGIYGEPIVAIIEGFRFMLKI